MLLQLLTARSIEVPADAHDVISSCKDSDQLDAWFNRAATAETINDLWL